jgi:hypothetical protein
MTLAWSKQTPAYQGMPAPPIACLSFSSIRGGARGVARRPLGLSRDRKVCAGLRQRRPTTTTINADNGGRRERPHGELRI